MKLIGKLGDGKIFLRKGHEDGEEPYEFKTDEGMCGIWCCILFNLMFFL